MWPLSIYSVTVTHKEKHTARGKYCISVCVYACVCVTYGITTFQAVCAVQWVGSMWAHTKGLFVRLGDGGKD